MDFEIATEILKSGVVTEIFKQVLRVNWKRI